MKYAISILFMSGALVYGIVFAAMAIGGMRTRKVYHTAGCPPIVFKTNPVKFVAWTVCLVGMSIGLLSGAVIMARAIMNKM